MVELPTHPIYPPEALQKIACALGQELSPYHKQTGSIGRSRDVDNQYSGPLFRFVCACVEPLECKE